MQALLNSTYESALKLLVPLTPEETYLTIVEQAVALIQANFGSIFLLQQGELKRVYSTVPGKQQLVPRKNGYVYRVFKSQQPLIINTQTLKKVHPEFPNDDIKMMVLLPLSFDLKCQGVLSLQSSLNNQFSPEQIQTLKIFASFASLSIRNVQLYTDMKKALDTKGLFLSMASHELKTPLTTISGYVQLLARNSKASLPLKKEWIDKISDQTRRLKKLINELLVVNELRVGKFSLNLEALLIQDVLQHTIHEIEAQFIDRKINYQAQADQVFIFGDREKLGKVFHNILHNALKFSDGSSAVSVTVSQETSAVKIVISDQGMGMSTADLEHVFEEFHKGVDNTQGGMGLGLFISQKIILAHQGSIKVKSKQDQGTSVCILLPFAQTYA